MEYASLDHPAVESKVYKADEKLFRKVTVEDDHVLRQYLPQNKAITYNLRPRPHNFLLPPKDEFIYHAKTLSERNKHYTLK